MKDAVVELEGFVRCEDLVRARVMLISWGDKVVVDGFSLLLLDVLDNVLVILIFFRLRFHVGRDKWLNSPVAITVPAGSCPPRTKSVLAAESRRGETRTNQRE